METFKISKKLHERRNELSLTQKQVADYVGVTEATVSRWESGEIDNMRRDKIAKLAKVLQVSPLFIMGIESDNNVKESSNIFSSEDANILRDIYSLTSEGRNILLDVLNSLKVTHAAVV